MVYSMADLQDSFNEGVAEAQELFGHQVESIKQQLAQRDMQIDTLKHHAKNLHWMARRYADMRQSYAVGLFNDITRSLLSMGVNLNKCDGTLFARDAMGRSFDGLTDEEVGPAVAQRDAEIARLRERVAELEREWQPIETAPRDGTRFLGINFSQSGQPTEADILFIQVVEEDENDINELINGYNVRVYEGRKAGEYYEYFSEMSGFISDIATMPLDEMNFYYSHWKPIAPPKTEAEKED